MEIEHLSALINAMVSATVFMGCIVLVAAFWLH
jgi:hypothetical protein